MKDNKTANITANSSIEPRVNYVQSSVVVDTSTTIGTIHVSSQLPLGLVRTWEQPEPPPREFIIEGLIPTGFCTQLYGDGGLGKSYIAAHMGMTIVRGEDYGGRKVKQSSVVYVDAELDKDEFMRRAYQLARGMSQNTAPEGLYYYKLNGPLTDETVQGDLEAALKASGAEFFVLDSMALSSYTADQTSPQQMIGILKYLETLGTWLVLDHIAMPRANTNQSNARSFGSVFKGNVARSTIQLLKADGGGLCMVHKKSNFTALQAPLNLNLEFKADTVSVRFVGADDPSMAGIGNNLSASEQVYNALASFGKDGSIILGIEEELGEHGVHMASKTIQNHLTQLKKSGRVGPHPIGMKKWVALGLSEAQSDEDDEADLESNTEELPLFNLN